MGNSFYNVVKNEEILDNSLENYYNNQSSNVLDHSNNNVNNQIKSIDETQIKFLNQEYIYLISYKPIQNNSNKLNLFFTYDLKYVIEFINEIKNISKQYFQNDIYSFIKFEILFYKEGEKDIDDLTLENNHFDSINDTQLVYHLDIKKKLKNVINAIDVNLESVFVYKVFNKQPPFFDNNKIDLKKSTPTPSNTPIFTYLHDTLSPPSLDEINSIQESKEIEEEKSIINKDEIEKSKTD